MELIIKPFHGLPCELEIFIINGKAADSEDFGDIFDHNERIKKPHGCGDKYMDKLYIPGDLVYIHGSLRIISNCDGYYATYYDETESLQEVNVNMIKGIPLTPEILEKNGWKKDKDGYINYIYHIKLCESSTNYAAYKVVNNSIVWLRAVENVSDLQHLLFGLDISLKIEV